MGSTTIDMNLMRSEPDPLWEHEVGRWVLAVFVLLVITAALIVITGLLLRRLDPIKTRRCSPSPASRGRPQLRARRVARRRIVPSRNVPRRIDSMDTRSDEEIRGDLSFLFDKASQSLASRMSSVLAEFGITARDYCVLSKAARGELTQRQLGEIALMDKTTMVVTLDRLEKAGLARRVPSPTDRRARIVKTTEDGQRVVEKARAVIDGLYDDVLGVLSADQRAAFLDAMVALVGVGRPLGTPGRP